jgi:hypothetical protein
MKKNLNVILFWGALWGITEATLGYVLHIFSIPFPGLPGLLMFPVAFVFMHRVYDSTQEAMSIVQVACVAASIKLTDLLFGGLITIYVINPALSLILEALAVALVFSLVKEHQRRINFVDSFAMGWIWRGVFLGYMLIISMFFTAGRTGYQRLGCCATILDSRKFLQCGFDTRVSRIV